MVCWPPNSILQHMQGNITGKFSNFVYTFIYVKPRPTNGYGDMYK